jgi:lysophospholipase L1-like esterase
VRRSVREILLRTLLVLAATAVGLLLAEVALRAAGFSFHLYPERFEFGMRSEVLEEAGFVEDPDLLWAPKNYRERLTRLEQIRPALVFLGDSCTQYGVYDKKLVERIEAEHPGFRVGHANLGAAGWSTYQGLEQMKRDIPRIRPRVAVIYFGWNDHWMGLGAEDGDIRRVERSLLYRFRDLRVAQLASKVLVASRLGKRTASPRRVPPDRFRSNLTGMVRLAREHGIEPVLVTAPCAHERGSEPAYLAQRCLQNLDELVPLHQEYVGIVREVGAAESAAVCDLSATLSRLPASDLREKYFKADGVHMTPLGDERAAECLYETLRDNGLLPKICALETPRSRL